MLIAEMMGRFLRPSPSADDRVLARAATPGLGVPVTAKEAAGLRTEGVLIIDVREPREWFAGHVHGSRNIPLDVIGPALLPADLPVLLVCRNGHRARQAARLLSALGVSDELLFVLDGGLQAWTAQRGRLRNRDERAGRLV